LLRPIKSLTKKLNNDLEKVEELIVHTRQCTLKNQLVKLQQKKESSEYFKTQENFESLDNFNIETPYSAQARMGESNMNLHLREEFQSPVPQRRMTTDMSPIAETVLISEDQMPIIMGGPTIDDGMSDYSVTPNNDNKNMSQLFKSDISMDYSVLEVDYKDNKEVKMKESANKKSTFLNNQFGS